MARGFGLQSWCLSIYLGTAPIYWLPGVSFVVVDSCKTILFIIVIGLFAFSALSENKLYVPRVLWGPVGFLGLIVLSIPGIVQAIDVFRAMHFVINLVSGALFLWCSFTLTLRHVDIGLIFHRAAVIVALFAMLTVTNRLIGLPSWYLPEIWQNDPYTLKSLANAGFGSSRSGWSNELAPYLPILLFISTTRSKNDSILQYIVCIAMAASIISSQIIVGGRAGILASVIIVGAVCFLHPLRKIAILTCLAFSGMIAILFLFTYEYWIKVYDPYLMTDLNRFSAGRMTNYSFAIDKIQERPFFGNGIGNVLEVNQDKLYEIHNFWLQSAATFGILMPLLFFAMFFATLCCAARVWINCKGDTADQSFVSALGMILIAGIVISNFHPNYFIEAFHQSPLLWAAMGAILGYSVRRNSMPSANHRT